MERVDLEFSFFYINFYFFLRISYISTVLHHFYPSLTPYSSFHVLSTRSQIHNLFFHNYCFFFYTIHYCPFKNIY